MLINGYREKHTQPWDWEKQRLRRGVASNAGFFGVSGRRQQPLQLGHHRGAETSMSRTQPGHPGDEMGERRHNATRPGRVRVCGRASYNIKSYNIKEDAMRENSTTTLVVERH